MTHEMGVMVLFQKLSEESQTLILETAIEAFANHGYAGANVNKIAKEAGFSVGVLYKYYDDKEGLFLACVKHSLKLLKSVLDDAARQGTDIEDSIRKVIEALIDNAKKHPNYNVMYNEITSGGAQKHAVMLAEKIEEISAQTYTGIIENARKHKRVKGDMDSKVFAFFFDNLLMMLQFSYSCEYYKERMKIFCGEQIYDNNELMVEELMKFIKGAFSMN